MPTTAEEATALQKALVCLTSFSCACLGFFLGVVLLLPAVIGLLSAFSAPDQLQQLVALLTIFGTPIVAALVGLHIGVNTVVPSAVASGR